ncbi:hypothetical protein J4429_00435 [Candidatus Pacearchaeota archaeon]|nr:hypothetical protein [uncultured archaeon]AQS32569.1 hypothetical protein [uncultured archaeon]AQS33061.1 hypothetical protein [uncultured archaeon]AQS34686.1 hypothetical protein [uncultured archaeon]MBS3074904.1 hypothetical protein [Candidatus Pacearchaeota archaeon]
MFKCPNNIFKKNWTQKEINFLKENYENILNKDLVVALSRDEGGINYMVSKLKLKKDYDFYCKSRKKYLLDFPKETFKKLYLQDKKSIREIAKIMKLGKNTVDYYLKYGDNK